MRLDSKTEGFPPLESAAPWGLRRPENLVQLLADTHKGRAFGEFLELPGTNISAG